MSVATARPLTAWKDEAVERAILDQVSLDAPWLELESFATLVRSSGSPQEREAVNLLTGRLGQWGVPYTLHEPECFISLPGPASVRDITNGVSYRAKTSSMSRSSPSTTGA